MGLPYRIRFFNDRSATTEWMAGCGSTVEARDAIIYLNRLWDIDFPLNKKVISRFALHEVMELSMAEYKEYAESRFVSRGEEEKLRHSIIVGVENAVFGREVK